MSKNPTRNYAIEYVGKGVKTSDVAAIATAIVIEAAEPTGDPLDDAGDTDLPNVETLPTDETDTGKYFRPDGVGGLVADDLPAAIALGADALDYRFTADDLTGPAPAAPLTIPTYDSSDELVHPSIVFVPEGWNGHRYWLAATPYPGSDDTLENPSIWVSDDGETWVVPDGVTNPIIPYNGVSNNSDTHLAFGPEGALNMFYREGLGRLYVTSSFDGVIWSDPVEVFTDAGCLSPSFLYDRGEWVCWYVDFSTSPNVLRRRTADAVDGTWSSADTATLTSLPGGREPWHVFVTRLGAQFVALIHDVPVGDSGTLGNLYFATSLDGLAWTVGSTVCIPQSGAWYDYPYRGTMIPTVRDGALGFDVWFSAYESTGPVWQVGRTLLSLPTASVAALDDLTDVTITAAAEGDHLRWNGSAWVNDTGMICVDPGVLAIDDGTPFGLTLTSVWGIDGTTPYYDDTNVDAGDEAALFYDPLTDNYTLVAYDF